MTLSDRELTTLTSAYDIVGDVIDQLTAIPGERCLNMRNLLMDARGELASLVNTTASDDQPHECMQTVNTAQVFQMPDPPLAHWLEYDLLNLTIAYLREVQANMMDYPEQRIPLSRDDIQTAHEAIGLLQHMPGMQR